MKSFIIELRVLNDRLPARASRAEVGLGDKVLVSTENGLETALIVEEKDIPKTNNSAEIIRKLNEADFGVLNDNREHEEKILPDVIKAIEEEKLPMKLTKIAYTYDRQKLFIYYTANKRVDFRKFIRLLGSKFKVRIQMVQIGVRDKASIVGGVGICGREICCHKFLRNIESVNIEMARNQNIALNPENISGSCGRLLCCLRYENCLYECLKKELPTIGKKVNTPSGRGEVIDVNYITKKIMVKLSSGAVDEFGIEDIDQGVKGKIKKWIK